MAAGCRSGIVDEHCFVGWLVDQVCANAWRVNVLDENALRNLGQDDPIFDNASAA